MLIFLQKKLKKAPLSSLPTSPSQNPSLANFNQLPQTKKQDINKPAKSAPKKRQPKAAMLARRSLHAGERAGIMPPANARFAEKSDPLVLPVEAGLQHFPERVAEMMIVSS
jgi:hypothetical protein